MIELDIIDGKLIKAFATDGKACFSLEIPDGVTEVADGAFAGVKKELFSVTKIVLPASLRRIGAKAFKDVTRLRSLKLPSNLEYIGDEAFAKLEHIKTLTIPNKVTHIGKRAFCGCIKLNKIKIGKGVAEIGEGAFADCSWVRSVEGKFVEGNTIVYNGTLIAYFGEGESFSIPANVERIGDKAFHHRHATTTGIATTHPSVPPKSYCMIMCAVSAIWLSMAQESRNSTFRNRWRK